MFISEGMNALLNLHKIELFCNHGGDVMDGSKVLGLKPICEWVKHQIYLAASLWRLCKRLHTKDTFWDHVIGVNFLSQSFEVAVATENQPHGCVFEYFGIVEEKWDL
jgi:hypothetical protein